MAVPYTFANVKPQDVTLTPFPTYKRYTVSGSIFANTSSGYTLWDAVHTRVKTPIGSDTAANDPTNSIDGTYQHIIWKSIDAQWYRFPYDSTATLEHSNKRYTYKFLNYSASHISIPAAKFGEAIKCRSVEINNSTYNIRLVDDMDGNLYDPTIVTSSYAKTYANVAYWGFNNIFRRFRTREGNISYGTTTYHSRMFEPDEPTFISNVGFDVGVDINGTGSGMAANFDGTGYMMTHNRPEFNFTSDEDFTISTWVRIPISQSILSTDTNTILSKRGVIRKSVFGLEEKYNQSDRIITAPHISSSIVNESTDVYPYDIDVYNTGVYNGRIRFRRSDGKNTISLLSTGSINDGRYHHIAISKISSNISLYVDGTVHASGSELYTHPVNAHSVIFGAINKNGSGGYSGSIDEIRMYNYGADSTSIRTLSDNVTGSLYQTNVIGNVFYRSGNIIISPLIPKYISSLRGNWSLDYRGTHTIFQYETLIRIKAGSFNLTLNPTARRSPKSDLLIDAMTGSGVLTPYFSEIGLYNGYGDLVAVAKLSQAVQTRDDVDLNVLIRFDA